LTTLAQMWLENHEPSKDYIDAWVSHRLGVPAESCLFREGVFHGHDLVSEKLVFGERMDDVYCNFIERGVLTEDIVLSTVHMPSAAVWVEWPAGRGDTVYKKADLRYGVLFERSRDGKKIGVCSIVSGDCEGRIVACGVIEGLPWQKIDEKRFFHCGWTNQKLDEMLRRRINSMSSSVHELFAQHVTTALFCVFLMEQPKLRDIEEVTYKPSLQRKRISKKKLPLVEYRKIRLKIAGLGLRGAPRVAPGAAVAVGHEGGKRKYHRVFPYFRTRETKSGREYVQFIDEHWRGDPELGVVFHERLVTREKPHKT
jgi:hypothetical protein